PVPFVAQIDDANGPSVDLFVQLIDVNGDGLPDMVARFKHPHDQSLEVNQVWINTGTKWEIDRSISVPYALDAARWEQKAIIQMVDVNADGQPDVVLTKGPGVTQTWLGNGRGWQRAPDANWAIPSSAIADTDGDPGYRLVDVDGDGFLDVYFARTKPDGTIE